MIQRSDFLTFSLVLILFTGIFSISCSENENNDPQEVKLGNDATLGSYLTDSKGKALYISAKDVNGTAACADACLTNWPVFYDADLKIPTSLNASDFSSITRSDGSNQTTYKGWPLYYFKDDMNNGDKKGEGLNGTWFVAKPDYSLLIAEQDGKKYLTDPMGKTLYYFLNDTDDQSNCTGGCLNNWPVYVSQSTDFIVPATLNKTDFGTITSNDNKTQVTYKGWPLYYFNNDAARGEMKGQGVIDKWFIAQPGNDFAAAPMVNVKLATHTTLGKILVDAAGKTLYYFAKDFDGNSACNTAHCMGAWPVFNVETVVAGMGLNKADFGTLTKADGTKQTTYKGWPLYYFAADAAAGETKGENVNSVWFVAKPDYTVMIADNAGKKYFVNELGKTLYVFADDTDNVSNCSGTCLANWPEFYKEGAVVVPSGMAAADFTMMTRGDGKKQMLYKMKPLYFFLNDANRGQTLGEGLNANKWQLANVL